jgi:hypothetical protein
MVLLKHYRSRCRMSHAWWATRHGGRRYWWRRIKWEGAEVLVNKEVGLKCQWTAASRGWVGRFKNLRGKGDLQKRWKGVTFDTMITVELTSSACTQIWTQNNPSYGRTLPFHFISSFFTLIFKSSPGKTSSAVSDPDWNLVFLDRKKTTIH